MKSEFNLLHLIQWGIFLFFGATAAANDCGSETCEKEKTIEAASPTAAKKITRDQQTAAQFTNSILATINSGDVELVKYAAKRGWLDCPRGDERDCDYLSYAARSRARPDMLEFLLSQGFEISLSTVEGAANGGNFEAIRLFCDRGADINPMVTYQKYSDGEPAGYTTGTLSEMIKYWLSQTSEAPSRNPLGKARILSDSVKIVEYIEGGGCTGAARAMPDNYAALVAALQSGDLTAVRGLLKHDSLAGQHPRVQVYLLYEAASSGSIRLLRYLKTQGLLKRCRDSSACFPVHIAAQQRDDASVIEFLISEGFSPDAYNHALQGATPLHYAATSGNIKVVRALCERGAKSANAMFPDTPDEQSTLDALRKSYGDLWCALNANRNDEAITACDEPGSFDVRECTPGLPCHGVAFPPAGDRQLVNRIMGLAKTFEFINAGSCAPRRIKRVSAESEEEQQ